MSGFNLSEWALRHRSFVWYLMIAFVLVGTLSYQRLGREEDPAFTIKTMVVQANWPGATVEDMTNQVTDRIERKLQELASLDNTKSYSTPGQTTIFVNLKDATRGRDIPAIWVQVRNKINDIREGWRHPDLHVAGFLLTKMDMRITGHVKMLDKQINPSAQG